MWYFLISASCFSGNRAEVEASWLRCVGQAMWPEIWDTHLPRKHTECWGHWGILEQWNLKENHEWKLQNFLNILSFSVEENSKTALLNFCRIFKKFLLVGFTWAKSLVREYAYLPSVETWHGHEMFKWRLPFLNVDRCLTNKWPTPHLPLTLAVAASKCMWPQSIAWMSQLSGVKSQDWCVHAHAYTHACARPHKAF